MKHKLHIDDKTKKLIGRIVLILGVISSLITIYTFFLDDMLNKDDNSDSDFYFEEFNGYYILTKYTGNASSVTIPEEHNGEPVVVIGSGAFRGNQQLKEVYLPSTVEMIYTWAFADCTALKKVEVSGLLRAVEENAFNGCKSLEKISLPDGLEVLNEGAFKDCSSVTEIIIPGSVEKVEKYCFYGCSSLKKVTILEGSWWIKESAFRNCLQLTDVFIPSSLKNIDEYAFYNCPSLKSVLVPGNCTYDNAFEERVRIDIM